MTFWLIAGNLLILTALVYIFSRKYRKLQLLCETERLKNEVTQRKDIFENLLDAVADPIFVKNQQHQWIYGNAAFSKLLGLKLNEYIGKSDYDLFPREMADVFWEKDNETLESLKVVENEEFITQGNEIRTIWTKKTPVPNLENGTVLIGVIRDITERKRSEETIRNLFRLIEASGDFYCICDLKGKPTFINTHGEDLGYSTELPHFRRFISQNFDLQEILGRLNQQQDWEGEVPLSNLKTTESIPYWMRIFYIRDENLEPKNMAIVATNIRERKEAELKLLFTSKMASLGEMAGGIAHEINNPLAIISGKAEQLKKLAAKGELDPEKLLTAVDKIEETSFRISKIIRGLRSFSRAGDLDPMKEVEVKELIEETLDLCRERMKNENIRLILEFAEDLRLRCRPTQIQQVLINLLNNSIDAINGQNQKWIKLRTTRNANELSITIIDSGTGIPKELQDKIMNPFFTTKEVGKGTGLGLSISKGIMESHQGSLRYNGQSPNTSFSLIFIT